MKKSLFVVGAFLTASINLQADMSPQYQQAQSAQALKELDCEFEDCSKKVEPKVIIKEKVVYRDRPVEKVIVKEKVVYRDRPQTQSKPQPVAHADRQYNKLFLDISVPNDPTFIRDYVSVTKRAGGADWNEVKKRLLDAPNRGPYTIKVTGFIELPRSYATKYIYIKPLSSYINSGLKIAGVTWNNKEIVIKNDYQQNRAVPFEYKVTFSYYQDKRTLFKHLESYIPNMTFMASEKPEKRGQEKQYEMAKVFIEE